MSHIDSYIRFIEEIEGLKSVTRSSYTRAGRSESTAEHSWRLAVLAMVFLNEYPELDPIKVFKMALIHDIGELYDGDTPAIEMPDEDEKYERESSASKKVYSLLPINQAKEYLSIFEEYNAAKTPEAKFVKALDKAETILQHNQGLNPLDFDYDFNLDYGKQYFTYDPLMRELREILDQKTRKRVEESRLTDKSND